jgi:hypothetical protein
MLFRLTPIDVAHISSAAEYASPETAEWLGFERMSFVHYFS